MGIATALSKANGSTHTAMSKFFNNGGSGKSGSLGGIMQSASGITKSVAGTAKSVGKLVGKAGNLLGKTSIGKSLGLDKLDEALNGKTEIIHLTADETTGIQGFLERFKGSDSNEYNNIDSLNTFDCFFSFDRYPDSNNLMSRLEIGKMTTSGISSFSYIDNDESHFDWTGNYDKKIYLFDMGIYVQNITLPQMSIGSTDATSIIGNFQLHNGYFVKPDQNTIQMDVVNTRKPMIENFFYPWMREIVTPKWAYSDFPYTKCTIMVDFREHSDIMYVFTGCRPVQIGTYQPSQQPASDFTRQITFAFDYMFIKHRDIKNFDGNPYSTPVPKPEEKKGLDKVLDTINEYSGVANGALFSAANTLKI